MTKHTHKFCCETLKKLDYNNDHFFYFAIVHDTSYDILTQIWTTKAEPFPAICYQEPQWYGEVSHEQFKINNCPFCGVKIKILTTTQAKQSQPKVKDEN